jgi:hypothetical protein
MTKEELNKPITEGKTLLFYKEYTAEEYFTMAAKMRAERAKKQNQNILSLQSQEDCR